MPELTFEAGNFYFGTDDPAPEHVEARPDAASVRPGSIWLTGTNAEGERVLLATGIPDFTLAATLWVSRTRHMQVYHGVLDSPPGTTQIFPPLFNEE